MPFLDLIQDGPALVLQIAQATAGGLGDLLSDGIAEDDPSFVRGWDRVLELRVVLQICADLALALLLSSAIAFHPRRHGSALSTEEVEYPKTVLLYAVVGTMDGHLTGCWVDGFVEGEDQVRVSGHAGGVISWRR